MTARWLANRRLVVFGANRSPHLPPGAAARAFVVRPTVRAEPPDPPMSNKAANPTQEPYPSSTHERSLAANPTLRLGLGPSGWLALRAQDRQPDLPRGGYLARNGIPR